MLEKHASYLVDPLTNESMSVTCFEKKWEHIRSGELIASTNTYPIIKGVPRLLTWELKHDMLKTHEEFYGLYRDKLSAELRVEREKIVGTMAWPSSLNHDDFLTHQKKTAESFWFERNTSYEENTYEMDNFIHFLGWLLPSADFENKIVLDVGCGSWRFTKMTARLGAKLCIGVDLSEAVEFAFELTHEFDNILIVQGDIYHLPFEQVADIAYSIGVLHHLPDPKQWFLSIPNRVLKDWWQMLIRVYSKKNNARALYFYEPMRTITRHIPKRLLLAFCHIPAFGVHLINLLSIWFAKIGFKRIAEKMPFRYYTNFPYSMKHNDAFDVLATPKSNYYYLEDIQEWFTEAKLKHLQGTYLKEAGLTFIGTKGVDE